MPRWEFCQVEFANHGTTYFAEAGKRYEPFGHEKGEAVLARLGGEGWELVAALHYKNYVYMLKRPLSDG